MVSVSSENKEAALVDVNQTDSELGEMALDSKITKTDLAEAESSDPALARKIFLINNALDEIGFTWYHAKLFCVAGFGYSVDSQMEMIQSAVKVYVDYQMKGGGYPIATEVFYAGLIVGSILVGFNADIIGRRLLFNWSLFTTSIIGFVVGGMDNYPMYCIFMFLSTVAAGGNIATDVSVFMEYLPSKYGYLNTMMAGWWGVGQTIASLISWAFIPNYSCASGDYCPSHINRGWRYCWWTNSGIVLGASLIRIFFMKLDETPKFLVTVGRDEEAFESIKKIAEKYNRPLSLTLEELKSCGEISEDHFNKERDGYSLKSVWTSMWINLKTLFTTSVVTRSTILLFISWGFIGISYSTFYNFLYIYIASHGGDVSSSTFVSYRNATLANFVGIFGPILAGGLIMIPKVGRRGTMIFGALASMAILFGYTTVRTAAGDGGFSATTYFFINIYYGTLYAYTPEVLPSAARTTGIGLALVVCRIFGAFAPVVYYFGAESGSSVPIWVCGAIIGSLSLVSALLPFEPSKSRPV
ncbi:hypothetical protein CANARDRAFT_5975 [[Candida] arabinofermentans NRRL YB-2248]|uniref:Major facilitator superfamily (MFS) profile domain-containing protein n=1 Tax=[Candida] arabinofermentans NRRL YB-2248 TaxID=983967 RepID=A0A1E4T6R1_9ASCO|nr:hypothetical protein CANARDRAFT_5975 [[Candida] arabinofermentans NRRL YB-2248]